MLPVLFLLLTFPPSPPSYPVLLSTFPPSYPDLLSTSPPPPFSTCLSPFCHPAAPGAAPGDVALQSDPSQAAITVSWSPLPSQFYNSDELTGYTIHYEANDVRIQSSGDVTTGPTATSRTLTGLHARVAYTISVAAVNSQGTGPYSSEQTAITSGQG